MNHTLQNQSISAAPVTSRTSQRAISIVAWVVSIPLAFMLLMAGVSKLRGVPMMVGLFDAIGVGQWFRYLTGGLEVTGALLLFVPRVSGLGALTLASVMLGAIATHIFIVGGSFAMPAALLAAALFIAYARREQVLSLLRPTRVG